MVTLRLFQPDDLSALYAISLATGHAGGDASPLYEDQDHIGHIYSAPYALLAPDLALVVVDEHGLAGFAVGILDTLAWENTLERLWWPKLRARYLAPAQTSGQEPTPDQRRIAVIHKPERTAPMIAKAYPAHLHLNLLPRIQGRGVGSALLQAWLDLAGDPAVHVGVNASNSGGVAFWRARDFQVLDAATERTIWMGRERGARP
ncbi:GNAT family N-acetyltransferase [soil metagenome]